MTLLALPLSPRRLPSLLALALLAAAPSPVPGAQGNPGDGCCPPTTAGGPGTHRSPLATGGPPGRCVVLHGPAPRRTAPRGTWIWPSAEPAAGEQAFFQHVFRLPARPVRATLLACCDDVFELRANGRAVAASSSWYEPVRAELAEHLVAGVNELRVAARNDYGPAGLLVELALELEDGARVHVVSDEGWICTSERPADWDAPTLGKAVWWRPHGFGARGVAPWGDLEGPPPNVIQVPGPMSWPPGLQPPALRDGPRVWVPTVLPDELLSKPPGITILPPLRVTPPEELVREQLRKELEERMRRRLAPRADDEESDPSPAPEDAPAGSPEERP